MHTDQGGQYYIQYQETKDSAPSSLWKDGHGYVVSFPHFIWASNTIMNNFAKQQWVAKWTLPYNFPRISLKFMKPQLL